MLHDEFFWISMINKGTVVINRSQGLIDEKTARLAAGGIAAVEKAAQDDASKRVKRYIDYEPMLIAATSPEVTLIHAGKFDVAIRNIERLLHHSHDLIRKANGWMLREIGKKDESALLAFLDCHAAAMPRTALRYAVERLSPEKRRHYMGQRQM